jgi:acetyltransferase-like isoleucine patch superfamily enzyme
MQGFTRRSVVHFEDPLTLLPRALTWLYSRWVSMTFPFPTRGTGLSIHYTCELHRRTAHRIKLGSSVVIAKDVWLSVDAPLEGGCGPAIVIDDGCRIGRRCTLSAKNSIHLERDVLIGPSVLIMDHNHAYDDLTLPIKKQGVTEGGRIRIGQGCWIGHGAAIVCSRGDLVLGRNCVVGANAVVVKSFPAYSVISGNPAKILKQFSPAEGTWVLKSGSSMASDSAALDAVVSRGSRP